MARYSYRASDAGGQICTGVREAQSRADVLAWLTRQQLVPLNLIEEKSAAKSGAPSETEKYLAATSETGVQEGGQAVSASAFANPGTGKRTAFKVRHAKKEILAFTQQMAGLLSAGTPIDRALAILQDLLGVEAMGLVVSRIRSDVQEGAPFSDALARHPKLFNPYYLNIVKAGEASGVLPLILKRLAGVLEEEEEIRGRIKASMVYPLFLLTFTLGAVITLMLWVVPKFQDIFAQAGSDLPSITRLVVGVSNFMAGYWWLLVLAILGSLTLLRAYRNTATGRMHFDQLALKLPVFGKLKTKTTTARMARTLGTMLQSGVPLIKALEILQHTINNKVLETALEKAIAGIREGGSISAHFRAQGVFPPLALHMIGVGEESGQLEEMLENIARTYDGEVQTLLRSLLAMMEPAIIVVLTFIVGTILLAILLPVLSIGGLMY